MKKRLPLVVRLAIGVSLLVAVGLTVRAQGGPQPGPRPAADVVNNFGFPLSFSVEKMDPTADPRKDFTRYAAGRWLDVATIPGDGLQISGFVVMVKAVEAQLQAILKDAAGSSAGAPKGSPQQQVGDFYASGMDEKRLADLGVNPLKAEFDRIAAIDNPQALAQALARFQLMTMDAALVGLEVGTDPEDRSRYTIYAGDGDLHMGRDNYLKPEFQRVRDGYVTFVTDSLVLAGRPPEDARAAAAKILAFDTRIARKKLTAVERSDPHKRFVRTSYADFKRLLSNLDVDALFRALGLPIGHEVIVVEGAALGERNAMLAEYPWRDTHTYLQWELLRRTSAHLTPALLGPSLAFARVLYGNVDMPPRTLIVGGEVPKVLGHPLAQLYVAKHFPAETRRAVEDLVGRVRAEFRRRIETNAWLSPATRDEALRKLDKVAITVGHPSAWIDYSPVDIRRDDYFGNVARLHEHRVRRSLAKLGRPVTEDQFAIPGATLPIDVNAAYSPDKNNIEIPAAFLQPPFYDAKADPAVNYCSIGAVIGHELTHGFDSSGRMYDASGNVRDWWTSDDAKRFVEEAGKLVAQASAFEALPGLRLNGALEVGENLADAGGVALGYAALQTYLRDHPSANRPVDGFTPAQRCFLAWGQLWADKTKEGALRQTLPVDGHPPGIYRAFAPSQHERGFYEAFGIRAGDRMWLDEAKRAVIW